MSLYICRRCASASALRRARTAPSLPRPATSASRVQLSQARSLSASTPGWSLPAQAPPAPSTTQRPIRNGTSRPCADAPASTAANKPGNKQSDDNLRIPATGATIAPHIFRAQRRIDHMVKRLDVNALYLEFWKICSTETIDDQKLIWSTMRHDRDWLHTRQESIYRVFNSPSTPRLVSFPLLDHVDREDDNASRNPILSTISVHRRCNDDDDDDVKNAGPRSSGSTLLNMKFITQSHAKRLLQIHQYFQDILELPIGYLSRIALLVSFASRGDMITVHQLFRGWQQDRLSTGGKEMYSAVIRGLVGSNFQDSDRLPFHVGKDHKTGIRNHGTTQIYAALDLFYELLRQGGTPTFETYHSLILGLATFKNDMEAAELLLDHMIIKKKKPYVQVLHVMCREYVRRRDFPAAERIFGMLKEYGIRPRALTCNIMLRAVFQMSTLEALQHLGHTTPSSASELSVQQPSYQDYRHQQHKDLEAMALQLKRQKIHEIREYMRENDAVPDEATFGTLVYGFGHLKDGYADLEDIMKEMSRLHPPMEPTLIILNSLLFANLNHGRVKKAEAILDRMLAMQPQGPTTPLQQRQQLPSPFQNKQFQNAERRRRKQEMTRKTLPTVPGKGTFHALMLALVERGDIQGMERVLDKMIHTNRQQSTVIPVAVTTTANIQAPFSPSKVNLDADEYTANIMLLGYLSVRDFTKVDLIQSQIRARADWRSSSLFWDRDEDRRELIEFLRQQSSREVVRRSLLEDSQQNDDDPERHGSGSRSLNGSSAIHAEGELDDDIEIDVTTLSAKLRGLMSSSSSSPSSSSSS